MTPNEYQKEALRTASGMSKEYPRILNGLMGLNGEAGECIDILKKHLYQGHAFDSEHMANSVFPWPDEETLRNMRASGLISHNDYRTRLGLSPMKA